MDEVGEEFTVNDAGETIVVSRNALVHVEKEVMARIAPSTFRSILSIDSSAPAWAERVEHDIIDQSAYWTNAQDFTEDFAVASARVSKAGYPLFEMMSGYKFRNRELVRSSKTGFPLQPERAKAVMEKGETTLDHIAADGTIDGTQPLGSDGGTPITGVYNNALVTPGNASDLFTTAPEALLYSTADEQNAFIETMLKFCQGMEQKSFDDTEDTSPIDTIVFPSSLKFLFSRTAGFGGSVPLRELITQRLEYTKRVMFWRKPDKKQYGVDAGHSRRVVGLRARDMDTASFAMPQAPLAGRRFQTINGVTVPVNMVVGGFKTKAEETIVYEDILNAP